MSRSYSVRIFLFLFLMGVPFWGSTQVWHSLSSACQNDTLYGVVPHGGMNNDYVSLHGTDNDSCSRVRVFENEGDNLAGSSFSTFQVSKAASRVYQAPFSNVGVMVGYGQTGGFLGSFYIDSAGYKRGVGNAGGFGFKYPEDIYCLWDGDYGRGYVVGRDKIWVNEVLIDTSKNRPRWFNWSAVGTTPQPLYGTWFSDPSVGYVAGDNGLIMKSVDSGQTWATQNSGTTERLNHICFPTNTTGYAAGENGTLLRTLDGGTTWEVRNSGVSADLNAIVCPTESKCFVAGDNGKIIKTCSTGEYWEVMPTPTTEDVLDIDCEPSSDSCFAVGTGGTFLRLKNGTHVSCQQVAGQKENRVGSDLLSWGQDRSVKELRVMSSERKALRIRLIDVTGKVVLDQEKMITAGGEHRFSYNSLAGGAYVLSIAEKGIPKISEPVIIGP